MTATAIQDTHGLHSGRHDTDGVPRMCSDRLHDQIEQAAHLLPAQGPITVFIHHNTLHAFEDLPFTEAVAQAAKKFGCQPYLPKAWYREALARGRIRVSDLEAVLHEDLGAGAAAKVMRSCSRLELRLAMLQYPLRFGPTEELLWFVAETDALRRVSPDASAAVRGRLIGETRRWAMRDLRGGNEAGRNGNGGKHPAGPQATSGLSALLDRFGEARIEDWGEETWEAFTLQALWRVCCDGVATVVEGAPPPAAPIRHRDLLLEATGVDTDLLVHDSLVPLCAAFLDQGLAHWQLPRRDEGLYRCFLALYQSPVGPPDGWRRGLATELRRLKTERVGPLQSVHESLELLGVPEAEWQDFISATLLALRGWGGMIRFLEEHPDRALHPVPPDSLTEFLAVRLLMERLALHEAAREALGFTGPLAALRDELRQRLGAPRAPSVEQRAFPVFQLAQILGWTPGELHRLDQQDWSALVEEIEAFSTIERRRVLHLAYERRLFTQALDAIALHPPAVRPTPVPRFQVSCCLDEREESFRRHLEEVAPDVETFGIAGFYGVAMYYRGAADAHFVPLCPIVIRPGHWVTEQVTEGETENHERRARARSALGRASHQVHAGSRSFALGALLTAGLGALAAAPLVARVLFPRLTARLRRLFGGFVRAPLATRLQLERKQPSPGPENGQLGYSLEEMTAVAERQLRDIGLTSNFARLVLLLGHGSSSLNNPHKSAYDCGACGGAPGAPNGRALAQMLNEPRVREALARRGLEVPAHTVFVGGFHNTCTDSVTLSDLDRVPESHRAELEAGRRDIEAALARNAHERCRRFMSAPLTLSFAAARQHVEARSEDLAQTRPELGHATNALTIIARRERTRGLFLDRRAFLTSYDPTQDDAEASILTRLLQAVVPVCSGISLEYFFSRVDNAGFGCGTKLPHNVSALLGVMDGAASDLRTGLPWQMVEIHEPVRSLFLIETTPDTLLGVMRRNPGIDRLVRNGWIQLAILDPHSQGIQMFRDGVFHAYQPMADQLPSAPSSVDWYRGWRDHLEFAEVGDRPDTLPAKES